MGKVDKATKQQRIQQVLRLLLAFADPAEIRRLAEAQSWGLSDRQLRRYVAAARNLFNKAATRDRQQALGRHVKQLEVQAQLAMKNGNQPIVLRALHDLAKLHDLYPGTQGSSRRVEADPLKAPTRSSSVPRSVRLARLLAAEARGDADETQLLLEAAPLIFFRVPDTTLPSLQLHILAQVHATEQMEQLGTLMQAINNLGRFAECALLAQLAAYRLKTAEEGWRAFTSSQGLGEISLIGNAVGNWEVWRERVLTNAPSRRLVAAEIRSLGVQPPRLLRPEDFAKRWWAAYAIVERA